MIRGKWSVFNPDAHYWFYGGFSGGLVPIIHTSRRHTRSIVTSWSKLPAKSCCCWLKTVVGMRYRMTVDGLRLLHDCQQLVARSWPSTVCGYIVALNSLQLYVDRRRFRATSRPSTVRGNAGPIWTTPRRKPKPTSREIQKSFHHLPWIKKSHFFADLSEKLLFVRGSSFQSNKIVRR